MVRVELISSGNSTCDELRLAVSDLRTKVHEVAALENQILLQVNVVESEEARYMSEANSVMDGDKKRYTNDAARQAYVQQQMETSQERKKLMEMRAELNLKKAEIGACHNENNNLRVILQWKIAALTDSTWQRMAPTPDQAAKFLGADPQ